MKNLIVLLSVILISVSASAIECQIVKNKVEKVFFETNECCDFEEENTEEAEITIDNLTASILYLPFQEGIYINLYDQDGKLLAGNTEYEKLTVSTNLDGNSYDVTCSE